MEKIISYRDSKNYTESYMNFNDFFTLIALPRIHLNINLNIKNLNVIFSVYLRIKFFFLVKPLIWEFS